MHFDYQTFGRWLRQARVLNLPVMSQDQVAEKIGATQAKVSRWELEKPNTDPPTLEQIVRLSDLFDVDFIALARMCGRWNDELEQRVRVALTPVDGDESADKKGLSETPIIHGTSRTNVVPLPVAKVWTDAQGCRDSDRIAA